MNKCQHSMRKLGWRKGTQCQKCDLFLPPGLTWIPAPDEFMERGYTEGWETGVKAENERIIKLLEERHRPIQNACNNLRCKIKIHTDCPTCLDEYPCIVAEEIALIKGEK